MLLWILILVGAVLLGVIVWAAMAMDRAERRARRGLYRELGLGETTVEFLMERNGNVLAELSFLRRHGGDADSLMHSAAAARRSGRRPNLRLVQSLRDAGSLSARDGEASGESHDDTPPTRH